MNKTVVEQIIEGVAAEKEMEPENLRFDLQEYVCTDAIRALANHKSNSWWLQIETPEHVVEVRGNETVFVDGKKV